MAAHQVLPNLDLPGRVLTMRVLALALCLDGHVNLPDRFFFVRCASSAGLKVDRATMRQFHALEQLFSASILDASAINQLFEADLLAYAGGARGRTLTPSWWRDLLTALVV